MPINDKFGEASIQQANHLLIGGNLEDAANMFLELDVVPSAKLLREIERMAFSDILQERREDAAKKYARVGKPGMAEEQILVAKKKQAARLSDDEVKQLIKGSYAMRFVILRYDALGNFRNMAQPQRGYFVNKFANDAIKNGGINIPQEYLTKLNRFK